jgi:hypothetical protein
MIVFSEVVQNVSKVPKYELLKWKKTKNRLNANT